MFIEDKPRRHSHLVQIWHSSEADFMGLSNSNARIVSFELQDGQATEYRSAFVDARKVLDVAARCPRIDCTCSGAVRDTGRMGTPSRRNGA
jgi:hypothetical protein